ncbi:MAG: succinate-semialdehyde dehydrogenase / glutarate-semialdehyde dehydrogenase [Actinomycetota bacterium]|nr:succinate-semialdehyde dehydrogenase / glutarate-semialdehyde dehydrogenase [Actinomycetota bacterium]HQZ84582.1 succinic semialdehyde dehydrogenase [Actinomycetota bacterium]
MTLHTDVTPETSTPLADEVMSADLVRLLRHRVTSGGTNGVTVGTAPLDGSPLPAVPVSGAEDVEVAFRTARRHFPSWSAMDVSARARILLRFHDLVLQRRAQGLDIVQLETGKARGHAAEELADVLITSRYYGRTAAKVLRAGKRKGAIPVLTSTRVHHDPIGVVGIISPWNYPLTLAISDALAALVAGNTVVLKPDVQTMYTALWVVELLFEAGLPEGVLNVVNGEGAVVGPMVAASADYLMFTGSTAVGRTVAAQCGERLIGCSMELGGKNAMIICEDADPERAAGIAVGASFANAGQLCISMERIYVVGDAYQDFVAAFVRRTDALKLAGGIGWGSDVGSLISGRQLERVVEHVEQAKSHGAKVLAGGRARPDIGPYFYEPTILEDVYEGMTLCRNETFGPVASIYRVPTVEEAIREANDTNYGLNASVVTRSTKLGKYVASQLMSGTVNINEGYGAAWASIDAPMGGYGLSGIGRRHGPEGLLKYTEYKTVSVQRLLGFTRPDGVSDMAWSEGLIQSVALLKKFGMK